MSSQVDSEVHVRQQACWHAMTVGEVAQMLAVDVERGLSGADIADRQARHGLGPPALALGVDPPRPQAMDEPPRPRSAQILPASRLGGLLWLAAIMGACILGVVVWAQGEYGAAIAATMGWTTFVLAQLFNVFNARAEHLSAFRARFFSNPYLWIAVGAVFLAQLAIVHVEWLRSFFDAAYLDGWQFMVCLAAGSVVLWLEELRKLVARRRQPSEKAEPSRRTTRRAG